LQLAQPPESGFRYPVAPSASLMGRVNLRAVIGTDGAVRRVDVISGNRALAAAAVRAVQHWRYAAPEMDGHPVEAETNIAINFVGDDAVSISFPSAQ
jgi:TonB family protein